MGETMNDEQYKLMSNSLMSAHQKFDDLKIKYEKDIQLLHDKLSKLSGELISHIVSHDNKDAPFEKEEKIDLEKEDWRPTEESY